MTSVLLVKTSSLGDVVHNLPVVSDIRRALPDARIDWMVEASYAAIPALHPGLRDVIPVNVRRWRRSWWRSDTRAEMLALRERLRSCAYDAIIDTQGLIKSALLARAARGKRYGLDWASAREPLRWLYDRTFRVPWHSHAVERNRTLAALALGYALSPEVDYGVSSQALRDTDDESYAVLLHATSAGSKLWPEAHWIALAHYFEQTGRRVLLPWGTASERARSERLARDMTNATVPGALSLAQAADVLSRAHVVVGLDTGLTHLAGALGVPTVGVYVATDPVATGLYGCAHAVNVGGRNGPPDAQAVIEALGRLPARQ